MIEVFTDEYFMKQALNQAEIAYSEDEVPVGAIIVSENKIIAKAYNQTQKLTDVTAQAEIIAYSSATQYLDNKYLPKCTLYVTLEPCVMCAGMLKWAQFEKIVFGATDLKNGAGEVSDEIYHKKTEVVSGVMSTECGEILTRFFQNKRS